MIIKELTKEEFDNFSKNHILGSFYQTSTYGTLMREYNYKDIFIGGFIDNNLVCASLILSKTISINIKYGYAPRGFLIDYYDYDLLKDFTLSIKKYFNKKGYAFIKINPIITLNEVNYKNKSKSSYNNSYNLMDKLESLDYKKLKDNLYFESILTKYNPIVELNEFSLNNLDNRLQKKLKKLSNKGVTLIKGDFYNINTFYELVKNKDNINIEFYKKLYKAFDNKNMIDLFLLEINYHSYLEYLQDEHIIEQELNEKINRLLQLDSKNKEIFNEKMNSDRIINEIKSEIQETNQKVSQGIYKDIIAGAIVIKNNDIATIFTSGFDKKYNKMLPNHYLHYNLLNYYKNLDFKYMDINGMTGDFSNENPYKSLNEFKLLWNPKVYEYIGEFDLIINLNKYSLLWKTKALHNEFDKKGLKNII